MQKIIGLIGKKQSGKSTVGNWLISYKGYEGVSFAKPLKNMLSYTFDIPWDNLYGEEKEKPLDILCGKSMRYAMQTLGTEWGRQLIGEDIWVKLWEERIKGKPSIVVEDVRFPNEVTAIKRLEGTIIKIERLGLTDDDPHASETGVDALHYDTRIVNHSISQLFAELKAMFP